MHIELGPEYSTLWRGKPPQMLASDVPAWQAYREKHAGEWEKFYYNVAMTLRDFPKDWSPERVKSATYSLGKRVDVVAYRKDLIWLIEVTDRAMVRSVGQVIVYRRLWEKLRPFKQEFEGAIICRYTDEDIIYTCDKEGIHLIIVPI